MSFNEVFEYLKVNNYEILPGIDATEVARYVKRIEDYEAVHRPVPLPGLDNDK
jgi:hypothetical protein